MKSILNKIFSNLKIKNYLILKIFFWLIWFFSVSKQIVYLFNVWQFNYFNIPVSYLELSESNIFFTKYYILLEFLGILVFLLPCLWFTFLVYKLYDLSFSKKYFFPFFCLVIVLSLNLKLHKSFNIDNTLCEILWYHIALTLIILSSVIYSFFFPKKLFVKYYNYIYFLVLILFLIIPHLIKTPILVWEYWTKNNSDNFNYQILEYDNKDFIIFSYNEDFLITKELLDNTLSSKVFILKQDELNKKNIRYEKITDLKINK